MNKDKFAKKDTWEKEFDGLWESLYLNGWSCKTAKERNSIKDFIRKVRKQVVLETLEQVIKEVAVEAAKLDEKTIPKPTA